jgi:hypothetical protein
MKKICQTLFVLFTLFSFKSSAGLPNFKGIYQAQDDAHIVMKTRIEIVNNQTAEGNNRLNELLKQKYMCELMASEIFRCSVFTREISKADGKALTLHHDSYQIQNIIFEDRIVTPILTNKGDSSRVYTYKQGVEFQGTLYNNYQYADLSITQQIWLGNPMAHYFTIKNDMLLIKDTYDIQLSNTIGESVVVESSYSK